MLSPDQLESAGDKVAAIYNDIEARMLDHLVSALLDGDITQRTLTEINLLAQTHAEKLRAILRAERDNISDAVYETVEKLLQASDNDDMARTGSDTEKWPQQVEATVIGIQLILERDNIQMVEGAKQAFLDASIEAITSVNTGDETTEKALHRAVRNLEGEGISIITYQNAETGRVTVRNSVDVAVRRHIRTQIAQDGARMTLERIEEDGYFLVEVSSHEDSRPSHAEWQGRVYSLIGAIEIGGTKYPDLYSSTRYGQVDGLYGANCRHAIGPYIHGAPRAYEPNPKHPSGVDGAEIYQMEQKQRYYERQIRRAKRELRGAQLQYDREKTNVAAKTELLKAQAKLKRRQEAMRKHIEESNAKSKNGTPILHRKSNREWAGDMPNSARISASGRNLRQFIQDPKVKKQLKDAGITQKAFRAGVTAEMAKRGGTSADFASLMERDQEAIKKAVIQAGAINRNTQSGYKRAEKHAARYYEEVRKRNEDSTVKTIAKSVDMDEEEARRGFRHLFIEEHDLEDGRARFYPDYDIAQSTQRILEDRPLDHDRLLFRHENLEATYMEQGYTYSDAHRMANKMYNYEEELNKYEDKE